MPPQPFPPTLNLGIKNFFKSNPETTVKIITRPYFIALKVLFVIAAIAFIVIGLFMIDDSCGCVRAQDKQMMLMLKVHVGLGILMLILSLGMKEDYPRSGIIFILLVLLAILGIDSWIFYNYKRCVGNTDLVQSDKRFLSWLVTTMVISGALSLTTLLIIGILINRFGKGQQSKSTSISLTEIEALKNQTANKIKTKMDEKKSAFEITARNYNYRGQVNVDDTTFAALKSLMNEKKNTSNSDSMKKAITEEIEQLEAIKTSYGEYSSYKQQLDDNYNLMLIDCAPRGGTPSVSKCNTAQEKFKTSNASLNRQIEARKTAK